ncbi:MAG: B12-binding domain-containing radical SAM protein [Methylobacter sp.]
MSHKVLLIMPKLDEGKEFHHFPFGCLSIAAPLEQLGIPYDIFDERVENECDLLDRISAYTIVGISMFTGYQTFRGHYWLKQIRKFNPGAITVVGGPHPTALPEETVLSPLVDYVIAGYAEKTFVNLVVNIISSNDRTQQLQIQFPGIYTKTETNIIGIPTPKKYNDINWSPLPYHRLPVQSYINPATRRVMYVSQYGCPALCTFCATPDTRKWTSKPLEVVYEDLETLDRLTDFKQLCFFDATLFTDRSRTMKLVAHLDRRFPGRQWLADARAAELIRYTDEDFAAIKRCRADLITLVVGLESGSEHFAEHVIKKGRGHLKNFREIARRTYNAGIKLTSGVVFGFPDETVADLMATMEYVREIRRINPDFRISTTFFRALPGTELFDKVRAMGHVKFDSLEEWANAGAGNHYEYNRWADPPWMTDEEIETYQAGYAVFMNEHSDICI